MVKRETGGSVHMLACRPSIDAEKRQENRQYIPRILKEEEWK